MLMAGSLEHLLTGLREEAQAAPGAMWLRAMTQLTKAHSLAEMLALVRKETDPSTLPSEATIKRWSRGSQFPVPSQKGVLSRNRRKFRQPINVACPAPGRWGRPNSRVTSRHFDHGNASRTSRPDCSGLDEAD